MALMTLSPEHAGLPGTRGERYPNADSNDRQTAGGTQTMHLDADKFSNDKTVFGLRLNWLMAEKYLTRL